MSIEQMNCIICKETVVLGSEPGRIRKNDATWSEGLQGWVCFGCQCEGLADEAEACEDTLPNFEPEWPR